MKNSGQFKKGHTYVMGEAQKRKIGDANRGERHGLWREKPSYKGLHNWVSRNFGKPMACEACGNISLKRYHWANLSGEYKRDRSDWKRLCPKCHYSLDFGPLKNPNRRLSNEQLSTIRNTVFKYGTQKRLAEKFGVNPIIIRRVRTNKT